MLAVKYKGFVVHYFNKSIPPILIKIKQNILIFLKLCNVFQAFLKIKSIQVRKFHLAKSPAEQEKIATDPLQIFHQALNNCKPILDTTPVKRGGVTYKVRLVSYRVIML